MFAQVEHNQLSLNRRSFLRNGALGGLSLALGASFPGCASQKPAGHRTAQQLAELNKSSVPRKVELVQEIYERVAFSDSGIMYSMMWQDADGIRPFKPEDFAGKIWVDASAGQLQLDGPWDYLQGENSITASGLYLASQTFRYEATGSASARKQARRAFRSLDLIYQMGERANKPGWMNKPYGFRPSVQTSGDQYLDACSGLWYYHRIADARERKRIEQMFISFADYWRGAKYVLNYFGETWDQKGSRDSYNAIYAMINACAYSFSKSPEHLKEFEWWMERASWPDETRIDGLRNRVAREVQEKGRASVVRYGAPFKLAKNQLQRGEFLCWETVVHAKFVAVAAEMISESGVPFAKERLAEILPRWWSEWKYGMPDDFLAYYWFAVDLVKDTWRPFPKTELLELPPKDQWLFGDPFISYISQVRWNEPLARFLVTSAVAAQHCPMKQKEICEVASQMMGSVDANHLHWLFDPDGKQLLPEISYYGHCLSSEMPGSFLVAYWRGRRDKLW